jgi:hypothetical protein
MMGMTTANPGTAVAAKNLLEKEEDHGQWQVG